MVAQREQLEAEYGEIKCQFVMPKERLQVGLLPPFRWVWSLRLGRPSLDSSAQTDI